jgi:hypothetical protein
MLLWPNAAKKVHYTVPDGRRGHVNVSVCKKMAFWREAGTGGEERARGAMTVDFKQGTWEAGKLTTMNKGLPFQIRAFYFFSFLKIRTHPLVIVSMYKIKKNSLCRLK